jgi:hypothetical protein
MYGRGQFTSGADAPWNMVHSVEGGWDTYHYTWTTQMTNTRWRHMLGQTNNNQVWQKHSQPTNVSKLHIGDI